MAESLLVFRDEMSFVSAVRTAAALDPSTMNGAWDLLNIEDKSGAIRPALAGETGALGAVDPPVAAPVKARIDEAGGRVVVRSGKGLPRGEHRLLGRTAGAHLPLLARLLPGERRGPLLRVLYRVRGDEAFRRLVLDHLELGYDDLGVLVRGSHDGETERLLLAERGSVFLMDKFRGDGSGPVQIYAECDTRGLFLADGRHHPFEALLPADLGGVIELVGADGARLRVSGADFEDIGSVLELGREDRLETELDPVAEETRLSVPLRLTGRARPADPELWVLPADRVEELENLLEHTPEDELKHLHMAVVEVPESEGGGRFFVIREVLSGGVAHLLPETGRCFAPLNRNLPNLMLPIGSTLAPSLRPSRYAEAFALRNGVLTLVEADRVDLEGRPKVLRINEGAFRTFARLVDFIFDGEAERLREVIDDCPFELGEFAELDLVDPNRDAEPEPAPAPKPVKDEPESDGGEDSEGILDRFKRMLRGRTADTGGDEEPEESAEESEAPELVDEERLALEAALTRREGGPRDWYLLAELLDRADRSADALRCLVSGLWIARDEDAELGRRLLEQRCPRVDGPPEATEELIGAVLAVTTAEGGDAGERDKAIRGLWQLMQRHGGMLDKKSRWLMWRELLTIAEDAVEEARQREDLLGELVLRGVEDREIPAFVRLQLLNSTRLEGPESAGGERALSFLDDATAIVARIEEGERSAQRGLAQATLGLAFVELGEAERGQELAREARGSLGGAPATPVEAVCHARIAALLQSAGRGDQRAALREALDVLSEGATLTKSYRHRKGLEKWFQAVSDARLEPAARDELVDAGFKVLESYAARHQVLLLKATTDAIMALDGTERATALVRRLLALPRDEYVVPESRHGSDGSKEIIFYEELAKTLDALTGERTIEAADARRMLEILEDLPEQITEFTIEMACTAFRCPEIEVLEFGDAFADRCDELDQGFAALCIRTAVLRHLAEQRDRDAGRERLSALIAATTAHRCSRKDCEPTKDFHRLRIFMRLCGLVAAFGLGRSGVPLIGRIADFAYQHRNDYVRANLLSECAIAQARLGLRRGAMDLVGRYFELATTHLEEGRSGGQVSDLTFWVLESCTAAAVVVGETEKALEIARKTAELADEGLKARRRADDNSPTQFWLYQALIQVGEAALALGESEFAEDTFARALERVERDVSFDFDRVELLQKLAGGVKDLAGARRFELSSRILEGARTSCHELGDYGRDFLDKLVKLVADDVVRGESAYAMALKRWKGEEERLIRDRVSRDRIAAVDDEDEA